MLDFSSPVIQPSCWRMLKQPKEFSDGYFTNSLY
jgi:hypothetical protein